MKRKYLDDLGVTERPDLWNADDKRQEEWEKDREEYGFDERETWSMDTSFYCWLYERVMFYKERCVIDLTHHKFEYNGKEYTQGELIDELLERLKFALTETYMWDDEKTLYVREIERIWAELCPAMWW